MFGKIEAVGAYLPPKVLTNADLEKLVDTSDEWIRKRTGIRERRIAEGEYTSDLAVKALQSALEEGGIDKGELELIIVATITPDYFTMPSTATLVAGKMGLQIPALDISAACSGFIYGLSIANSYLRAGIYKKVAVIGAEVLSRIVNWQDRRTCVLFGDGAGAVILGPTEEWEEAIWDVEIGADGKYQDYLITPGRGVRYGCETDRLFLEMKGNETFKVAVKTLSQAVRSILERNNLTPEEVDHFIPHQANYRIIDAVARGIGLPKEKVVLTVDKYGNTSSASIPTALYDSYKGGRFKKGDLLLLDAFGGGFTWGSALVKWGIGE